MEVKLKKGNEVKLMKWAQLVDGMKWNQTSSGMNQINGMEGLHAQVEAERRKKQWIEKELLMSEWSEVSRGAPTKLTSSTSFI